MDRPVSMPGASPAAADDAAGLLRAAMGEHAAGRLDAAQRLYAQLLTAVPQHPDALHLLGVLEAQRGRHERAAELIGQAIAVHPGEAMFHNNLGNVCSERALFEDAERHYLRSLELDPARLDALNNLGVLWGRRGRADDAEQAFLRIVEVAPEFHDARQNLAMLYLRTGRPGDAVQQCFDALIVAPRHNGLRRLLGSAYSMMGRHDEAVAVYRNWLAAEPDHPVPAYHLAACTGVDVPERAPDAYVQSVFDSFAASFDAKLASLAYRAPQLVADAVARHAGPPAGKLQVLDAGCGTGLCAPLLAPHAGHLAGVDLSAGMLQRALARRAYDELVQGDLVEFLVARPRRYDLIVSADTLCYFGALEAFAAAACGALRDGGLLVFTVESHPDAAGAPDHRLHAHGRYSHRQGYLASVLSDAGFAVAELQAVVLRQEADQPVDGWLVVARAHRQP